MQDTPEDTIVCCNKLERTYTASADAAAAAASPREHALPQEARGAFSHLFCSEDIDSPLHMLPHDSILESLQSKPRSAVKC